MSKTLILMRHAKSSWDNAHQTDHQRRLDAEGREATPRVARWLAAQSAIPDRIVASDSRRTLETAEGLVKAWDLAVEIVPQADLYHAPAATYLTVAAQQPDSCKRLLLLGHNPGISILAGQISEDIDHLATAACAIVSVPVAAWKDLSQLPVQRLKLVAFQTPKAL